jgi:hypothetical protein
MAEDDDLAGRGRSLDIKDQRARITRGEEFLLFDPTAGALASAMGQVRLSSSRPIPFLMERTLYLVRMLRAVFA